MIARRKPLARSRNPLKRSPLIRKPKKVRRFVKAEQIAREAAARKADRDNAKAREICRYKTFMRAGGCCERCGRPLVLLPKAARHEFEIANIHEEPKRSLGGDPLDWTITVCLCCHCHALVTDNRVGIKWRDPELKAVRPSGPIFFPIIRDAVGAHFAKILEGG